jgi:3-hydroxyisobutyrate dehydrogenase-like beta-hydroxyacid dehydrogenase
MKKNMIGFVGLGNMGSGMVKNLLAKGLNVTGFDIDEGKINDLKSLGLYKSNSMSEIAKSCETVMLCLPSPEASRQAIFEQLLGGGSVVSTIIETSTLTPEIVKEFADKLTAQNIRFLSAPMIGGKNHAASGTIEFLVEGQEQVFKEVQGIFDALGTKSRFMGDIPSATLAKLTFNLSRYANLAVGIETYRLLEKYHANLSAIYEFMSEQSLDNFGQVWKEDLKETMTAGELFKPSGVPKKDLALVTEMAQSNELDTRLFEAIRNTYLSME